jgi:hypothetical protein
MKRVFLGLLLFVMLFIVSACTGKDTDRELVCGGTDEFPSADQ